MNRFVSFLLLLSTLFLDCRNSWAAGMDTSLATAGLRMFWGLLVVLGVLLLLYALARKRLSFVHNNDRNKIKILELRHIMPKKSLCLVEVEGKKYLLGLGHETITLLSVTAEQGDTRFPAALESATDRYEHQSS